jgi:hypothetical protein
LKALLHEIIYEKQSVFVPGRMITDNVLIAYECIHTIRKKRAKTRYFALRIDMTKACDRVEWGYLEWVLLKLGFNSHWVETVMRCVMNAKYAVKVNSTTTESFIPTRGIHQGDPINPYLFLLCSEGLSCLLQQKEAIGELKRICNGMSGPPISHLLFSDSVFFLRVMT